MVLAKSRFVKSLYRLDPWRTRMKTLMPPLPQMVRQWVVIWLAWTAAGIFYITQDFVPRLYRQESVPLQPVFVGWMAAMYICAAFTPAILWVGRRWPIEAGFRWLHVLLHLACSAAFSILSAVLEAPVLLALGVFPAEIRTTSVVTAASALLVYGFHGGVIRYWAVVGVQAVLRSHQSARRREREALELKMTSAELAGQLSAAQLSALKMQLQPHFLFNTLGAIMVLVQQHNVAQAEVMLARLSDLLRLSLEDVNAHEVPLWRELELLTLYLSIERVRFHDRLDVRITADRDVADALVPHMVLQPIVENAVRHGLGQSEEAVLIEVEATQRETALVLTVSDDGPGCSLATVPGTGIGLANTRTRLQRLYGAAASMLVENRVPRGIQVTIMVPFHVLPHEDGERA